MAKKVAKSAQKKMKTQIVNPPPTICKELRMQIYALNWLRVERLFKKGCHSPKAEWKGKNISILAIEGYGRRRDRIKQDKTITESVRRARIYDLEKALDFFVINYTRYMGKTICV